MATTKLYSCVVSAYPITKSNIFIHLRRGTDIYIQLFLASMRRVSCSKPRNNSVINSGAQSRMHFANSLWFSAEKQFINASRTILSSRHIRKLRVMAFPLSWRTKSFAVFSPRLIETCCKK